MVWKRLKSALKASSAELPAQRMSCRLHDCIESGKLKLSGSSAQTGNEKRDSSEVPLMCPVLTGRKEKKRFRGKRLWWMMEI